MGSAGHLKVGRALAEQVDFCVLYILKSVQSILIEINDDFTEQRVSASKILQESGLQQTAKLHSGLVDGMVEFGRTYNQIWERR